jgi:hypothetical protein
MASRGHRIYPLTGIFVTAARPIDKRATLYSSTQGSWGAIDDIARFSARLPVKLMVFILSCNAQRHITGLPEDIPEQYKNNHNTGILVIDDASAHESVEIARAYAARQKLTNIR